MNDQSTYSIERLIGELNARSITLERRVTVIETDIKTELRLLNDRLTTVNVTMEQARGGWRAIAWLSGIAATLGGLVTYFIHMFTGAS